MKVQNKDMTRKKTVTSVVKDILRQLIYKESRIKDDFYYHQGKLLQIIEYWGRQIASYRMIVRRSTSAGTKSMDMRREV